MLRAERVGTLNKQLKWVQHQVKNSAISLEFRLRQVMDVMVKESVYSVVDGIEAEFMGLQQEVNDLMDGLERHVMMGELAAATYKPRYQDHEVKTILKRLFRDLDGIKQPQTFRAKVDISALHHATSNLESNAIKYCAKGSKPDKLVAMYKNSMKVPIPSAKDAEILTGLGIGDSIPASNEDDAEKSSRFDAVLHIAVRNLLDPMDHSKLNALHIRGELYTIFNEGVRVAGERHAAKSVGDGLALTKSVVESLYGSLWLELDLRDNSITFNIAVPILLAQAPSSAHFKSGVGIIAVDDCATQRLMLTVYCKKMGIPFEILGESQEDFSNICGKSERFMQQNGVQQIIVVLDQNLSEDPYVRGTDLAKILRSDLRQGKLKDGQLTIFIRSGNTMTDDIREYLRYADGYLEKNDSYTVLRTKLLTHLTAATQMQESEEPEEDEMLQDMELRAIQDMKAVISKGVQKWVDRTPESLISEWSSAEKEIHSIKGSIKGLEGLMCEEEPDGIEILARVATEIDKLRSHDLSPAAVESMFKTLQEVLVWFTIE